MPAIRSTGLNNNLIIVFSHPRPGAGGPGQGLAAVDGQAGRPVDGAGRPVHRSPCHAVPPAPGSDQVARSRDCRAGRADRGPGRPVAARAGPAQERPRVRGRGVRGLAGRDRPRAAPVVPQPRQARLLGDRVPGEQHQRPQAQVRPDRGGRHLHQAGADPGRLGSDPVPRPAPGPVPPPGPPGSAATRTRARRRKRSSRSPIPCSRSPTRSSRPGSPTPTSVRTSTPAGNHPSSSTPTWNAGCEKFHPGCTVTITISRSCRAPCACSGPCRIAARRLHSAFWIAAVFRAGRRSACCCCDDARPARPRRGAPRRCRSAGRRRLRGT